MSYMHIDNLYKNQDILQFKECYAMEKIHGTSAHVSWKDGVVHLFAGGCKQSDFDALFNKEDLKIKFEEIGYPNITVFGEAYGGKIQGMRKMYGDKIRFVAFEVKVGESWLDVPNAEELSRKLGFDFVHYVRVAATVDDVTAEMNKDSVQAVKNGLGEGHKREGVVLRPPFEVKKNNGSRVIAKHKREDFQETKTKRPINEERLAVLTKASEVAEEWVTPMRLKHVLDSFQNAGVEQTGEVIKAMIADVEREAEGEIVTSKEVRTAVGRKTAEMFKEFLSMKLDSNKERGEK